MSLLQLREVALRVGVVPELFLEDGVDALLHRVRFAVRAAWSTAATNYQLVGGPYLDWQRKVCCFSNSVWRDVRRRLVWAIRRGQAGRRTDCAGSDRGPLSS